MKKDQVSVACSHSSAVLPLTDKQDRMRNIAYRASRIYVNLGSICYNKMDAISTIVVMEVQTKEYIMAKILDASKHGATKIQLMHDVSITYRRLRRIMAELVDRRFLKFLVSQEVYITTHRGHIFLDKLKKEISYSQDRIATKLQLLRELENKGTVTNQLCPYNNLLKDLRSCILKER
jgi:predicted transcriptional regulator